MFASLVNRNASGFRITHMLTTAINYPTNKASFHVILNDINFRQELSRKPQFAHLQSFIM